MQKLLDGNLQISWFLKRPARNGTVILQPPIFRGKMSVGFREGMLVLEKEVQMSCFAYFAFVEKLFLTQGFSAISEKAPKKVADFSHVPYSRKEVTHTCFVHFGGSFYSWGIHRIFDHQGCVFKIPCLDRAVRWVSPANTMDVGKK